MKRVVFILSSLAILSACKKNDEKPPVNTEPSIRYTELGDTSIAFGRFASFDLNGDKEKDVALGTQHVGDPLTQQDKKQWLVVTSFTTSLPVNQQEQIPVLSLSDNISKSSFNGYNWYNASSVVLAQKIITTEANFWEGNWKNAVHKFIPVQVAKANGVYNGWVEISFSQATEKLILHKAAMSKEVNQDVVIKY